MTSLRAGRAAYVVRFALWTLRQRRYAKLVPVMVAIALICVAAGTWQVDRYKQNVNDNRVLRANAHAPSSPLSTSLVPVAGSGAAPGRDAIRYRSVTVQGQYLHSREQFLNGQTLGGRDGFWVVDPLRTRDAVLPVVRGFVAATTSGAVPGHVAAPPAGTVTVVGRLQTASTSPDHATTLRHNEIATINPASQAARLGSPAYQAYLTADAHQPGTTGLRAVGGPELSNPAGGAVAPQHLAYVIQWYLFALLALAAPFAMARHEVRETRQRFLGIDAGAEQFDAQFDDAQSAVEQFDGDGRRSLEPGTSHGALAVRSRGELTRPDGISAEGWQRAVALADRYGRSFGLEDQQSPRRSQRRQPVASPAGPLTDSASGVHRSADSYHAEYNDYLWQLALADGQLPDVSVQPVPDAVAPQSAQPRVITADPDAG